ncbi:MAG TPA: glycosyltransferase family 2 protein [Chitinophagaceae bacterium]|jgi:glycosyltransferase involved in cell wall biosynthesis|nr:glycosyltransferase family 2 protein [Chitinophagaceae bacterium]
MDLSIVIPLMNEAESLPELAAWIERVMQANGFTYEIVFIDDGSTDESWTVIENLQAKNGNIRGIKFQRNYGKSAALNEGFRAAQGDVVVTMDADLQDSPDEIPELRRMILEEGFDLVSGWKKKRHDPLSKTFPSKLFNYTARRVTKIPLHDFNCGLKAYKKKVIKGIEVYGEMHRYIPVIAKWAGFRKVGEKVVEHRARQFGRSKFSGIDRGVKGLLDLASIMFIGKFSKRPMHFFGLWGSVFFLVGLGIAIYLIIAKFIDSSYPLTNRPGFYFALTAIILGMQLFLAGFISELISRNAPGRNTYLIEKKLGL